MLSSITPLGERARGRRWGSAVTAFGIGAAIGGIVTFGLLAAGGALVAEIVDFRVRAGILLVVALIGGGADAARRRAPSRLRQVDETWLTKYRGWVAAGGYGLQLGSGFVTVIPVFGTFALAAVVVLLGRVGTGILVGVAFAAGRTALLLTTHRVTTWPRLADFHQRLDRRLGAAHGTLLLAYVLLIAAGIGALR